MKMEQIEKLELNKIYHGDCIEVLKTFPDNSVDAVVCDPPYGLEFMGKEWDKFKEGKNIAGGTSIGTPFGRSKPLNSVYQYGLEEKNQFQEFSYNWGKEVLRVLKPGGFLLSFGGTRTYHRMVCGLEDAGFEIRDCIMWVYGSGFPKSLNIGKQIDKIQGNKREVIGISKKEKDFRDEGAKVKEQIGQNKLSFGIVENVQRKDLDITKGGSEWEGWGTSLKPAVEPIVVARKPLSEKSVALNVLKWGTGGINIDGCRIETNEKLSIGSNNHSNASVFKHNQKLESSQNELGRFPANIIHDGSPEVLEHFPNTKSGYMGPKHTRHTDGSPNGIYNKFDINHPLSETYGDEGSASRFFYCAKASKSERNAGLDDFEDREIYFFSFNTIHKTKNNHPTVKPIKLMEYLVKLISKENAIVLDCFMGSGTTAIACLKLNRQFIGIEKEPEYIEIAKARIKPYLEQEKLDIK